MSSWAQTLQAAVQFASEAADREWPSLEDWRGQSRVPGPLFAELEAWVSEWIGQPLWALVGERRNGLLQFAKGVREELFVLLAQLEPAHATAFLCALPSAGELGYSRERLMAVLQADAAHVQDWEQQAVRQLRQAVSERTPFLQLLASKADAHDSDGGAHADAAIAAESDQERNAVDGNKSSSGSDAVDGSSSSIGCSSCRGSDVVVDFGLRTGYEDLSGVATGTASGSLSAGGVALRADQREALLQAARHEADFDLRAHVAPALELAVRQALHREGLQERERVAEQIGDAWAVELIAERMMLERHGEEEEREDA